MIKPSDGKDGGRSNLIGYAKGLGMVVDGTVVVPQI